MTLSVNKIQKMFTYDFIFLLSLLAVPGPVGIPFTADNLTTDSCKLTWFFPEDDGGAQISNYIIEKREAERKAWTACSYNAARQNAVVQNLTLGKAYFFRVAAENAVGVGPFRETACELVIRESLCKFHNHFMENISAITVAGTILNKICHESLFSLAVPDRPEDIDVTVVTKTYISLTWKPPKSDGGSDVTSYVLEARMIGKDRFVRLTKDKLMDRRFTYDGLREGESYEFRVSAVNEIGQGKPSFNTKSITCRDELGMRTLKRRL